MNYITRPLPVVLSSGAAGGKKPTQAQYVRVEEVPEIAFSAMSDFGGNLKQNTNVTSNNNTKNRARKARTKQPSSVEELITKVNSCRDNCVIQLNAFHKEKEQLEREKAPKVFFRVKNREITNAEKDISAHEKCLENIVKHAMQLKRMYSETKSTTTSKCYSFEPTQKKSRKRR